MRKITCYEDYDYRSPTQIYESYSNRADKLVESKKFLDSSVVVDSYERGRTDACKGTDIFNRHIAHFLDDTFFMNY